MKKSDTKFYKDKLEKELELLERELSDIGIQDPKNPSDWIPKKPEENISLADENDIADTVDDAQINNAIVNDLEIRYNNIKRALEKIEKGTYGICEINNHPISEDRLKANPSARTCKEHINEKI